MTPSNQVRRLTRCSRHADMKEGKCRFSRGEPSWEVVLRRGSLANSALVSRCHQTRVLVAAAVARACGWIDVFPVVGDSAPGLRLPGELPVCDRAPWRNGLQVSDAPESQPPGGLPHWGTGTASRGRQRGPSQSVVAAVCHDPRPGHSPYHTQEAKATVTSVCPHLFPETVR